MTGFVGDTLMMVFGCHGLVIAFEEDGLVTVFVDDTLVMTAEAGRNRDARTTIPYSIAPETF